MVAVPRYGLILLDFLVGFSCGFLSSWVFRLWLEISDLGCAGTSPSIITIIIYFIHPSLSRTSLHLSPSLASFWHRKPHRRVWFFFRAYCIFGFRDLLYLICCFRSRSSRILHIWLSINWVISFVFYSSISSKFSCIFLLVRASIKKVEYLVKNCS